ncbi:MAG: rcc01693 family protein [Pseudomonadota bacterium]
MSFDWPGLMRAGMFELRLKPDEFWGLTPAELAAMLGRTNGDAPLTRERLTALADAYPDERE